jgi:hypothetical protein
MRLSILPGPTISDPRTDAGLRGFREIFGGYGWALRKGVFALCLHVCRGTMDSGSRQLKDKVCGDQC